MKSSANISRCIRIHSESTSTFSPPTTTGGRVSMSKAQQPSVTEEQFNGLYISDQEETTIYDMDTMSLQVHDGYRHDAIIIDDIGIRFDSFYQNTVLDEERLYFKRDGHVSASVPLDHLSDEEIRLLHRFYTF